jgi:hypothetical protein
MEIHLIEVKYCEDTRSGHQLEASNKQHKSLYKHIKSKQITLHTILLGVGGSIYTSNTLHHLKELGLDSQRAHKTALKLHAHSVHYAHKLIDAHLRKLNTLKVSVRSRGLPATLRFPLFIYFPLVGKTHGTSGQCVSFSLIDAGSVLLPE